MLKPLARWTAKDVEALPAGENSEVEWKGPDALTNPECMADVASAFANYSGGHIIICGGKRPHGQPLKAIEKLPEPVGRAPWEEWLEDKVRHLCDPPLHGLDVTILPATSGHFVVIEVRPSDLAPHQAKAKRVYYGRAGSKCYGLDAQQVRDIYTRTKTPVLEIASHDFAQANHPSEGPHYAYRIAYRNVGNAFCRSHHLRIEAPTMVSGIPLSVQDDHHSFSEEDVEIRDDEPGARFVIEIAGGPIYPRQEIVREVRLSRAVTGYDPDGTYTRSVPDFTVTLFGDPTPNVQGETEYRPELKVLPR